MTGIRLYVGEEILNTEENKELRSAYFMLYNWSNIWCICFGRNY